MRVLFVNPRAGQEDEGLAELRRAAAGRGIDVREMDEVNEEEPGLEVVGVAGGDGSLAPGAELALARDIPFVPVPLGTRNHFARDLGFDRDDPVAALAAFDGPEKRIDVGVVNGRLFLNNVSLGIYAAAVHDPAYEKRRDVALRRMLAAALRLRRAPLRLDVNGEDRAVLVLVIGNNEYRLSSLADLGNVGGRERLDGGVLHAYSVERGRWLRPRFETRTGARFVVRSPAKRVKVAIDGEAEYLEPPLVFEIRPYALRVRIAP